MENLNLRALIQEVISKFSKNRIGVKPPVFVTFPPLMLELPGTDGALNEFLKTFLYEALLSNDPEASMEVIVHRRSELQDLAGFIGIDPPFWLQLRVSGQGLRIAETLVEELFTDVGYRCEEWIGVENTDARLGIFSPPNNGRGKIVFCIESGKSTRKCDLLLPIAQSHLGASDQKH